ncbi:MAG: sigma-70 family RNA polymerase sigma factor [Mariniphaga sp.]|nr:sigma-70 family RNA polymerase sigma factor [Mariniphaga sp.]
MADQLSDEILMKHLASGDKKAAGVLYDRYYKKLYGYFARMSKDTDVARDLTQNVFLKVLKYSHSWKDDKVFAYWLFRIARNILVDYFNESKKFYGIDEEPEIADLDHSDSIREMEAKESYGFLLEAMSQLPPVYRELIELNRFQGFSYKEIAISTSSTENAVKVKTFRAIKKLKEIYTKIIIE